MSKTDFKQELNKQFGRLEDTLDERHELYTTTLEKHKQRLDGIEKANNRIDPAGGKNSDFQNALAQQLKSQKSDIRALRNGKTDRVQMNVKATIGGRIRDGEALPGVFYDPDRSTHVRRFLTQTSTSGNAVPFAQEQSYTDGTEGQTEGTAKGVSDFTLSEEIAPVETRASTIRIPKQMLDDVSFLSTYITAKMSKKIMVDEDEQLLTGDGTSPNVEGIIPQAQAATSTSTVLFDIIADGINQVNNTNGEYNATFALVNPDDYWSMVLEKGDDGHYLHDSGIRSGNQPLRINGVQVVPTTAMAQNEYLIGDSSGATQALREGINVRFFEQDQDNVVTNRITVRAEQRFALAVTNPNAFVTGAFTAS